MIETSAHYIGERGKEYFSGRFDERQSFGRRYQSRYFVPHCSPDKVLLDYGCGDGTILRQLPAVRKFGVEVNPLCRNKIHQLNEDLPCPITVFESIETIDDDSVDVAISNHCMEHVPHPFTVLSELKRVLAPGRRLVLVTPFDDWRQKGKSSWTPGDKDNHLYTWNPMNLGNLLFEAVDHDRHLQQLGTPMETLASAKEGPEETAIRIEIGQPAISDFFGYV